jgi:hypothetical protein
VLVESEVSESEIVNRDTGYVLASPSKKFIFLFDQCNDADGNVDSCM